MQNVLVGSAAKVAPQMAPSSKHLGSSSVAVVTKKKSPEIRPRQLSGGDFVGLYDFKETIGRGHFGVVKMATHALTKEKVAIKIIDKTKLDDVTRSRLYNEVRCMQLLHHPHIISLYEVAETPTQLFLILEYADGGDLFEKLEKQGRLPEETARRYFKQMLCAVLFCHELHIVHRDLKPENILFCGDTLKVSDFGMSSEIGPGEMMQTVCGSLAYSAPEVLLGDAYDGPAVDVWSLGVTLFMLNAGRLPFEDASPSESLVKIMEARYQMPDEWSDELRKLVSRMLVVQPLERATITEIKNSPWLLHTGYSGVDDGHEDDEKLTLEEHNRVLAALAAMNIDYEEVRCDLDAHNHTYNVATYHLLRLQQLRQRRSTAKGTSHHSLLNIAQSGQHLAMTPKVVPKKECSEQPPGTLQRALSAENVNVKDPAFEQFLTQKPVEPPSFLQRITQHRKSRKHSKTVSGNPPPKIDSQSSPVIMSPPQSPNQPANIGFNIQAPSLEDLIGSPARSSMSPVEKAKHEPVATSPQPQAPSRMFTKTIRKSIEEEPDDEPLPPPPPQPHFRFTSALADQGKRGSMKRQTSAVLIEEESATEKEDGDAVSRAEQMRLEREATRQKRIQQHQQQRALLHQQQLQQQQKTTPLTSTSLLSVPGSQDIPERQNSHALESSSPESIGGGGRDGREGREGGGGGGGGGSVFARGLGKLRRSRRGSERQPSKKRDADGAVGEMTRMQRSKSSDHIVAKKSDVVVDYAISAAAAAAAKRKGKVAANAPMDVAGDKRAGKAGGQCVIS